MHEPHEYTVTVNLINSVHDDCDDCAQAQKTAVTTLLTSPGSSTAAAQQQSSEEGVILVTGKVQLREPSNA